MDQQLKGLIKQFVDEITSIPDEQLQDEKSVSELYKKFNSKREEFRDTTRYIWSYMGALLSYINVKYYYNDALQKLNKILDDETGEEMHKIYNELKANEEQSRYKYKN